jgi:hypothetical protein
MAVVGLAMLHFYDPVTVGPFALRAMVLGAELAISLAVFLAAAAWIGVGELKALVRGGVSWRKRPSSEFSAGDAGD